MHHEPAPGPVVGALHDDGELLVVLVLVAVALLVEVLSGQPALDVSVVPGIPRQRGALGRGLGLPVHGGGHGFGAEVGAGPGSLSLLAVGRQHRGVGGAGERGSRGGPEVLPGLEIGIAHDLYRKATACEKE